MENWAKGLHSTFPYVCPWGLSLQWWAGRFFVQEYKWKHTFPLVHHRALAAEGLQTVRAVDNICTAAELWTVQAVHSRLMFVGGLLLHLWLQSTVVLPGEACVYPFSSVLFSVFSPIFISVSSSEEHSSLQTDSAVLVCSWVTFPCVFCSKQRMGRKISSSDHAGLNVSVSLEFRGRIWNMNWPSFFCSACSSFTENMRLRVAAMCVVIRTSPYSLVLYCFPHSFLAILMLSQSSMRKQTPKRI